MDIQRQSSSRRWLRRGLLALLGVALVVGTTAGLARLKPAMFTVEKDAVLVETVRRGPMLREVRGYGTLVPEEITWVTPRIGGQVRRVAVEPGVEVHPDTLLAELWDPRVERALKDAKRTLESANNDLARFKLSLDQQLLNLRADTAQAQAAYEEAKTKADMDAELHKLGLISRREHELSQARKDRSFTLLDIQVERIKNTRRTNDIQLAEREADVARAREILQDRQDEVDSLSILAGVDGILEQLGPSPEVPLQVGQNVGSGTPVAKIINPQRLKAVLKIQENQAKEVTTGQRAAIDTHNGVVAGRVMRIDPAVENGTVAVDVQLQGELPQGSRPDLTVEGTIELEHLEDVLSVRSPPSARPQSVVGLFKLLEDGSTAVRTTVRLGRVSVHTVEILEGLHEGDRVIISATHDWDDLDRIRLK